MSTFMGELPEDWLRRPLCKRYAFVVFRTALHFPNANADAPDRAVGWALGTVINGDREILGAWDSDDEGLIPAEMFGRLYERGVEYITYAVGDLPSLQPAFIEVYPRAVELPSIEQSLAAELASVRSADRPAMSRVLRAALADPAATETVASLEITSADWRERYPDILDRWGDAVAAFQPLFALPEPYRTLVRSVDRTAMEVQERLMRAIHRHGPFANASEAFAFVAAALQRADRQLERERQAGRLARDICLLPSGRIGATLERALGAPTVA